ncbi:SAV_915 family protein [Nocardioides sp. InS609-2]|uniref:SAV_915 family protein n=1 Tax=Nocardioides sp. InS609-2 TaxID=2760705 RepID=UPI0020BE1878|nr:SAV_915 family protein [Nocardioides sp. InS609-2]
MTFEQLPRDYPPFLYIPCMEHVTDGAHAEAQYRTTKDGRTALLVYSALDRLHACCGDDQPWFGLPVKDLQMLHDGRAFDVVYTDVYVPEERREPGQVGLTR